MVEPEMAFCDLRGNMDLAEAFLKHVFKFALETCPEDMEFFNQRIDNSVLSTADNIINNEFERVTYTEAIALLEKPTPLRVSCQVGFRSPVGTRALLAEQLFKSRL